MAWAVSFTCPTVHAYGRRRSGSCSDVRTAPVNELLTADGTETADEDSAKYGGGPLSAETAARGGPPSVSARLLRPGWAASCNATDNTR
jgi:hypothetical protein